MNAAENIKSLIRDIPDFPSKGILFRDITPVLQNPLAFKQAVEWVAETVKGLKPDVVIGIESRGFILGSPVALELGVGFVPVRKAGKLPSDVITAEYALEYGTSSVEMHRDAIKKGMRVAIVDDLLATAGTARAAINLTEMLGGRVVGMCFLIELEFLRGRRALEGHWIESLVKY
jgi:adenine phosphoribosyltransferase